MICDSLINFGVTREELLRQDESEIDSTTEDSPIKKKPKMSKKSAALSGDRKSKAQEKK